MKRLLTAALMLLCLFGFAAAESETEEAVLQAMLSAHPDYTVLGSDQRGDSAAAVLGRDDERILCIAEKRSGEWVVVVDNDKAIPDGIMPNILMDTDDALYWSYRTETYHYSYSSFRVKGVWAVPSCIRSEIVPEGTEIYEEAEHRLENGLLSFAVYRCDENGNILSRKQAGPYPAAWAMQYDTLAAYDDSVFPNAANTRGANWLNWASLFQCAIEIAPEYTFIEGAATDDGLQLLVEAADGTLRMITWSMTDGGPVTNVSSPLPAGTVYNDIHAYIHMPDGKSAVLGAAQDGAWQVKSVFTGDGAVIRLGRGWLTDDLWYGGKLYVGDHPWEGLDLDWSTLPATIDGAAAMLYANDWAVVNNPDPADRLHLRERANRSSRSVGKFYNGTPVEVLKRSGEWTRVRIPSGLTGWMKTEYLAFGRDAWEICNAFLHLLTVETADEFPVWKAEHVALDGQLKPGGDWQVSRNELIFIIGIADDDLYYVWFPDLETGGCMRQNDFWEGNG